MAPSSDKQGRTAKASSTDRPQPRLRSSCDACAATKLKCSQDRPRCKRCLSNGQPCVYGVSRKHGTIESRRQQTEAENSGEYMPPDVPCDDFLNDFASQDSGDMNRNPSAAELAGNAFSSPFSDLMGVFPSNEALSNPFGHPFSSDQDQQSLLFNSFDMFPNNSMSPMSSVASDLSLSHMPSQATSMDTDNAFFPGSQANHQKAHDCYAMANETLRSLHDRTRNMATESDASPSPPHLGSNPPQAFDSVLHTVNTAVSNLVTLLSCPCTNDPHMAMLYSSIISLVMYWCKAAAKPSFISGTSTPSSNEDHSPLSTTSMASSYSSFSRPAIVSDQVRCGAFTPAEEDQEPLRRTLLLCKLRRVRRLVEKLATAGEGAAPAAQALYSQLGTWLGAELSKTMGEVGVGVVGCFD